ncbi:hypothetical protein DYH09_35125 [bacterium CPR1]|nr:hypothetical protein [bacterium CPR1]
MELTVPNRWFEKGYQKGFKEGLEEGREEGLGHLRRCLTAVLESRFGALSTGVHRQIQELDDPEKIFRLLVQAATVDSLDVFLQALR